MTLKYFYHLLFFKRGSPIIVKMEEEIRELITRMEMCLDEDFIHFFETDIDEFIRDLEQIKEKLIEQRRTLHEI